MSGNNIKPSQAELNRQRNTFINKLVEIRRKQQNTVKKPTTKSS
jgi:hypothetical protein